MYARRLQSELNSNKEKVDVNEGHSRGAESDAREQIGNWRLAALGLVDSLLIKLSEVKHLYK